MKQTLLLWSAVCTKRHLGYWFCCIRCLQVHQTWWFYHFPAPGNLNAGLIESWNVNGGPEHITCSSLSVLQRLSGAVWFRLLMTPLGQAVAATWLMLRRRETSAARFPRHAWKSCFPLHWWVWIKGTKWLSPGRTPRVSSLPTAAYFRTMLQHRYSKGKKSEVFICSVRFR